MNPKLFVVTLWAEDVALNAHFYRDVIGLPLASHHDRPHFDLGGVHLTHSQRKGDGGVGKPLSLHRLFRGRSGCCHSASSVPSSGTSLRCGRGQRKSLGDDL